MQAFEWIVRDVHRLRDYMENMDAGTEATDFDVLRESPMLGDGKFKLEIGVFRLFVIRPHAHLRV